MQEHHAEPLDAPVGCVMIGPGTGVAPFRGFIQHQAKQAETQLSGKTLLIGATAIELGDRNVILESAGHHAPAGVNDAQRRAPA